MPLYFSYISIRYLKNLFLFLFGLASIFALIDYLQHLHRLEVASNYKLFYLFYIFEDALGLLYPLAILFALILTTYRLSKDNTMSALHSFGYSKKKLLFPFLIWATILHLIFIFLYTTSFAYARDRAENILKHKKDIKDITNLFFKYENSFVYIEKLNKEKRSIENITLFKIENHKILYTIEAQKAYFNKDKWIAKNAKIKKHIYKNKLLQRFEIIKKKEIAILKGYKPNIIESFNERKSLTLYDAYTTWIVLSKEKLNSTKIKAFIYSKIVTPLFALALLIIFFFKFPFHLRMINMGKTLAFFIGVTIIIWGLLFALSKIGSNGLIMLEISSFLPIFLLFGYAIKLYNNCYKTIL